MTSELEISKYHKQLRKKVGEIANFITDLQELVNKTPKFASLLSVWKPIGQTLIQIDRLQKDEDKLALISVSRYLYEQAIQCMWLLKSSNVDELEIKHVAILKMASIRRLDYLALKEKLEPIKSATGVPEIIKMFCDDLTKNVEADTEAKEKNKNTLLKLDEYLKNKNITPLNGTPPLTNMAEQALPCGEQVHNRALHDIVYKILSIATHSAVPFAGASESKDFYTNYEGGTAAQVSQILTIKMIEFICDYTNKFIQQNSS